jgi:hypothetical protein
MEVLNDRVEKECDADDTKKMIWNGDEPILYTFFAGCAFIELERLFTSCDLKTRRPRQSE